MYKNEFQSVTFWHYTVLYLLMLKMVFHIYIYRCFTVILWYGYFEIYLYYIDWHIH